METIFRNSVWVFFACLLAFCLGCATLEPKPYQGFTTKTSEAGGLRLVVENMRRGEITQTFRIDKSTSVYDVVAFDVTMTNIGNDKVFAFGDSLKLITDDGTVVESTSYFVGGFDGSSEENKSHSLYPGTKKSGVMVFALKKTLRPVKLIFRDINTINLP